MYGRRESSKNCIQKRRFILSNKQESRTKKTIRNSAFGFITKILSLLFLFLTRNVFISILGNEYLSLTGLFMNILSVLSLAELGFGSAMLFHFYEPLAKGDQERVKMLIHLYKKIYQIVALFIFIFGMALIPFLKYFVTKKPDIDENMYFIYILFVFQSVLTYFWVYKKSILVADQNEYIATRITSVMSLILMVLQIIALYITRNFVVYCVTGMVVSISTNLLISNRVNKLYPYIREKDRLPVDQDTKDKLKIDVKSVLVYKLGNILSIGLDNIIISRFIGLGFVGILSNYILITDGVSTLLNTVMTAATGSVGNLNAQDSKENQDKIYRALLFISFWLYGFSAIAFSNLLNPFITLWLGDKFLYGTAIVLVISINTYLAGMQMPTSLFRDTLRLYQHGKFSPFMGAVLNLIISLVCVQFFGVLGVLLGTLASRLLIISWFEPRINYKYGLKKSPKRFFAEYVMYLVVFLLAGFITMLACSWITSNTISSFLLRGVIVAFVPNCIFVLIFHRTSHFKYLYQILKTLLFKNRRKCV